MMTTFLVALAAGAASALMFTSIISGTLIALVLVCLASLPLMVAALAWSPPCGAIASVIAMLGLGTMLGLPVALGHGLAVALPAWWLAHLALLGRSVGAPNTAGTQPAAPLDVEWYPVGRILLWIAALAALTTTGFVFSLGSDVATISETLRQVFARAVSMMSGSAVTENDPRVHLLVAAAPVAVAVLQMATLTVNLWLATKVAAVSGRLPRAWPDLKATALPPMTLVALCVAVAFAFSGGLTAILAVVVAAVLMMAYALVGLAVLHTVTLDLNNRPFWLATGYAVVLMFSVGLVLLTALGVADAVFGLRERFLRRRPPPLPTPEIHP